MKGNSLSWNKQIATLDNNYQISSQAQKKKKRKEKKLISLLRSLTILQSRLKLGSIQVQFPNFSTFIMNFHLINTPLCIDPYFAGHRVHYHSQNTAYLPGKDDQGLLCCYTLIETAIATSFCRYRRRK